jgi:hypothetical protein
MDVTVPAADRPISRTAYLHVDYKKVTPIEGRKAFITATMPMPKAPYYPKRTA